MDIDVEEKYKQYKAIYEEITHKEPKNSLESLIQLKNNLEK